MELNEFRIFKGKAGFVGHCLPISGDSLGVCRKSIQHSQTSSCDQQGFGSQREEFPGREVKDGEPCKAAVFNQHLCGEGFVVTIKAVVSKEIVVQGLHFKETGFVGSHAGAGK